MNIPQGLLWLNLALEGAAEPDHQELTDGYSYCNSDHRVPECLLSKVDSVSGNLQIVLYQSLNSRNAASSVDFQDSLSFCFLLQYPDIVHKI